MGDFSSCNRTIKRQLFRKNRTIQVLFFMAGILFMITMYKHLSCDGTGEFREQDTNGARVTRLEPTSSHKLRENIFLFIMVLTAPNGQERRTALRKTWLSNIQSLDSKVVVKFIIGGGTLNEEQRKNLKDENKLHRDILLLPNVNDSYSQLTNKVLQTFRWIDQNINCVFVLKVDDDTFVRLDTVVSELRSSSSTKKFYWGFFRGDAHVKSKGSWLENNWNLCDRYLPYAQGGGYILSSDLVHFIAKNSDLLRIFNSEDVSVGTWLAPLQVNRAHDYRFDTEYKSRGCNNAHILSHKQSVMDIFQKHNHLQKTGKLCTQEFQQRSSFKYNWKVPPSQCCVRVRGIP